MGYQIINGKEGYDESFIKEFDEKQFFDIVEFVNNLEVNCFGSYDLLYQSKYSSFPGQRDREILYNKIDQIKGKYNNLVRDSDSSSGYEWIFVNRKEIKDIAYRYYFGINPINLYKLVEKLTEEFSKKNIPVEFKFQKESKKTNADRIILYTDAKHKPYIEQAINEVYTNNKELFVGAERALPWIYNSNTPNVFFAPESLNHKKSFGELFQNSLEDSKKVFHYLYQIDKVENMKQVEVLKKIIMSMMLRNGLLLAKDGRRLSTYETGITTFYDKEKNTIKSISDDKKSDYYEIEYGSNIESKKAFLNNFYAVKTAQKYPGMKCKKLTREERNQEIYNFLYPGLNNDKKNRI